MIGGAHLGYNKQFDKWVVGVEGAVDPTVMSRGVSINVPNSAADPTGALGIGATATGSIGPRSRARFAPAPATPLTASCSMDGRARPRRVRQQFPNLRDRHDTVRRR